jgi:hypothetical protein
MTFGSYSIAAGGQKLFQLDPMFHDYMLEAHPEQIKSDCVLD